MFSSILRHILWPLIKFSLEIHPCKSFETLDVPPFVWILFKVDPLANQVKERENNSTKQDVECTLFKWNIIVIFLKYKKKIFFWPACLTRSQYQSWQTWPRTRCCTRSLLASTLSSKPWSSLLATYSWSPRWTCPPRVSPWGRPGPGARGTGRAWSRRSHTSWSRCTWWWWW